MTTFNTTTLTISEEGLFPRRELKTSGKTVQTPAKALPVTKATGDDEFADGAQGIAEVYQTVDAGKLRDMRKRDNPSWINTLASKVKKAGENDLVFVHLAFKETRAIEALEAEQLMNVIDTFSDVLTVPLQPRLVKQMLKDEAEQDLDAPFQEYLASIERILMECEERFSEKPVMGTLPPTGWSRTGKLLRQYHDFGVEAFCLNFNGRKVTAARQVSMLGRIAEHIGARRLQEDVVLYGINIDATGPKGALGFRPAMNFAPSGVGFDIIGENHIGLQVDPSEMEGGEEAPQMDEDFVRLFDREAITFAEVLIDEIDSVWPAESGLDADDLQGVSSGIRSRRRKLFNAEQLSLALQDLRDELDAGSDIMAYLRSRPGVTPEMFDAFEQVRGRFDHGRGPNVAGE
jgi:hypothetical protein